MYSIPMKLEEQDNTEKDDIQIGKKNYFYLQFRISCNRSPNTQSSGNIMIPIDIPQT